MCLFVTGVGFLIALTMMGAFREVLGMLSGEVEAQWAAGTISRDHALRLWHTLPLTGQALVENGPDLVDTFIPGPALAERAAYHIRGDNRRRGCA